MLHLFRTYFTTAEFLLLALALPCLIWWWQRQRGEALRFPATGWLGGLPSGRGAWARRGGLALRALTLLLLIVALAGPRWPDHRTRIETEGIALAMTVDVSGSMAEKDFDWQWQRIERLEAVKRAFGLFVQGGDADGDHFEGRPSDLIALVTFATRPESPCPLTLSHGVLLKAMEEERPRGVPDSQTNISDAILLATQRLNAGGSRRKVMILLSDGEHNVTAPPSGMTPRQAAQVAGNLGIRVYTIDAGGDSPTIQEVGGADSVTNRVEGLRTLQEVAQITGGRCFPAHDTRSLLAVCHEIDGLERSDIASFQYRRYYEGFAWFALAALGSWLLLNVLELTVWQRIP
jgi:Ca-activated chloride channel family protein